MEEISYRTLPYYKTDVSISKTQDQIKKLLVKYHLIGIRFTEYQNIGIIEFILKENGKEIPFRFKFILPENESHKKQVYRALLYYLKARFTSVDFGINTIEKEFLQEIILKLPSGEEATVKEVMENKITQLTNNVSDLLLPFTKKEEG